ncbi:MAG: hypothetical protein HWE26_06930 [Alteromonadaceae bacterium]|nr:hypothetical protein [Alteromonadaceae bacterium]
MVYFEMLFIALSLIITAIGFSKTNRKLMLAGYVCLMFALGTKPFLAGFEKGYNGVQRTDN